MMISKLLRKLLEPIIIEILRDNGIEVKSNPLLKDIESYKKYYIKLKHGYINYITSRIINDDEYKRLKK